MTMQATHFDNICESKMFINTGSRCTLHKGESITFANLPQQPIAIVGHNNNGLATHVMLNTSNHSTSEKNLHIETQSFSVGCAYIINPDKMQANEMSLSLPETACSEASIDIQIVNLYIPDNQTSTGTVFLDGNPVNFHSCANEPIFKQLFSF